jgi:hypothetical protein
LSHLVTPTEDGPSIPLPILTVKTHQQILV